MSKNLVTFELDELVELLEGFRLGHRIEPDNTLLIFPERIRVDVDEAPILMGHVDFQPWETTMDEMGDFLKTANEKANESADISIFCKAIGCNTPKDIVLLDNTFHDIFIRNDPIDAIPILLKETKLTAIQKVYGLVTLGEHVSMAHAIKPMEKIISELNTKRLLPVTHNLFVDKYKGEEYCSALEDEVLLIEKLMKDAGVDNEPALKEKVAISKKALEMLRKMHTEGAQKEKENKEVLYQ